MNQHTPGPWRVLTGGLIWTDQPGPHGIEPDGHSIAQVTEHRTSLGSYVEEADARLIAAAPELLEALRSLVTASDFTLASPRQPRDAALWSRVESARAVLRRLDQKEQSKPKEDRDG